MKFNRSVSLILALVLILGPFSLAEGTIDSAVAYLGSKTPNPWSSMALVAAGRSADVEYLKTSDGATALELEAPILALAAAGKDPRTFGSKDLVAKLLSLAANGQIGDPASVNDDIFGILALIAAGEPENSAVVQASKQFLTGAQHADGGWSFSASAGSDTNTTAAAIMALRSAGVSAGDPVLVKGKAYLLSAQNADGGFPYDPKSPWGTGSDSSSDAFVIAAANALGEDAAGWTRDGKDPLTHLRSLEAEAGFFRYQEGSAEDAFSAVTTAYAVVALSGKYFPVGRITPAGPAEVRVNFRIEGGSAALCTGEVSVLNALQVVEKGAALCGYNYHLTESSFGSYVDTIGTDTASGSRGWLYRVNYVAPNVGAAEYKPAAGDEVLWYFANFDAEALRLSLDRQTADSGQGVGALVEVLKNGGWTPEAGVSITAGSASFTTDTAGKATLALPDGAYNVRATKEGFVRSAVVPLRVGAASGVSLPMSVEILPGVPQATTTIAFTVTGPSGSSDLEFGSLNPGLSAERAVTLKNSGNVPLTVGGEVTGSDLFRDNTRLKGAPWRDFSENVGQGSEKQVGVRLTVPLGYVGTGTKNGALVFWAAESR